MKWIAFFTAVLILTHAQAGDRKSVLTNRYSIVSDVFSADVPAGKCVVIGTAYTSNYSMGGAMPLPGAMISTLDKTKKAFTDEKGEYKLLLDAKDTTIFMFSEGHEEIVIWKYAFQSRHIVTINFYPDYYPAMMEVDKPVIYLYSAKPIAATVKFESKGSVTFTYPEYENGWNVQVNQNGLYSAETGKTYPYLFWEGESENIGYVMEESALKGFIIKTDTVVSFLENTLQDMGLNATEQTDFITFWAPRMITGDYALVQFLINDVYTEKISSMVISPTPDNLFRMYMLFSPLQSDRLPVAVQPQQFEPFDRTGFTVVEWGGSELPPITFIP